MNTGIASNDMAREVVETLAARLLDLRAKRRIPGSWVAAEAGIAKSTYYRLERGLTCPRADHVALVAEALGVSTDYLLGLRDRP